MGKRSGKKSRRRTRRKGDKLVMDEEMEWWTMEGRWRKLRSETGRGG